MATPPPPALHPLWGGVGWAMLEPVAAQTLSHDTEQNKKRRLVDGEDGFINQKTISV